MAARHQTYPLFMNLRGKPCLVVGGGRVAQRKIAGLLRADARVRVVSPAAGKVIQNWAAAGRLVWQKKVFAAQSLRGVQAAFAATDDRAVNRAVAAACRRRGILVNVADKPEESDFFVPAVIRRKSLTIAISTNGKSPLFAKRLRRNLEGLLSAAQGESLELLGRQRARIHQLMPDAAQRRRLLKLLADEEILYLLKTGDYARAKKRVQQCISSSPD
jgi:precorrin-2 dehydrogenase/sirohydrochlorin ferrochelatase